MARKINRIIIHCSATPEGKDYTVADIDRWHREKGYNGIGYHYVIYRDGSVHTGRDINVVGAHCQGHNSDSIGICYIGGMTANNTEAKDTRTDSQKKALRTLVDTLCAQYGISRQNIYGHNEFAAKDCPCFSVKNEYRK